jgi:hypothetical protein
VGQFILKLFEVMRLRIGPQDMPAGRHLAIGLSLAYVAQGFIADRLLGEPDNAPRSLLAITAQYLIVMTLLNWKSLSARIPQTITAMAGTGLIFGALSLFLVSQANPGQNQPALALVWFGLFIWSIVVDAHIYRHALSITMSLGVLVAVMIFAANFMLIQTVF